MFGYGELVFSSLFGSFRGLLSPMAHRYHCFVSHGQKPAIASLIQVIPSIKGYWHQERRDLLPDACGVARGDYDRCHHLCERLCANEGCGHQYRLADRDSVDAPTASHTPPTHCTTLPIDGVLGYPSSTYPKRPNTSHGMWKIMNITCL